MEKVVHQSRAFSWRGAWRVSNKRRNDNDGARNVSRCGDVEVIRHGAC